MKSPRHFLLFCPDLSGHRHLYAGRAVDYCFERGYRVTLAYAGKIEDFTPSGKVIYKEFCDAAVTRLLKREDLEFIDLLGNKSGHEAGSLRQLDAILAESDITDVLHLDADLYRIPFLFYRPKKKEIRHHLLFIITEFLDWKNLVSLKQEVRSLWWVLRNSLYRRAWLRERLCAAFKSPRFTERVIVRVATRPWISSLLTTDERLEILLGGKTVFLTEFGSSHYEGKIDKSDDFALRTLETIQTFCDLHPEKTILFACGDLEPRKGFDLLLQLAVREHSTICIRIGRTKPFYSNTWQTIEAKEILLRENRLLEIDSYVVGNEVFSAVMAKQKVGVLPYRDFYRTSGFFVDCLLSGLPVVVPNRGLMGHRTRKHGLGETFQEGNLDSLQESWHRCFNRRDEILPALEAYKEKLSQQAFEKNLDRAFSFGVEGAADFGSKQVEKPVPA